MNKGILQPDMWSDNWENDIQNIIDDSTNNKLLLDWNSIRNDLKSGYLRNAYLTALMPTATSSNFIGVNESFEPFTTHLYTRNGVFGHFYIINQTLIDELKNINMWNGRVRRELLDNGGSVQDIGGIPENIKNRYKTARELGPQAILNVAKSLAPFICQSMSLNIYLD